MRFSLEQTELCQHSKQELRQQLRQKRRQLSSECQALHSERVKQHIISLPLWQHHCHDLCHIAMSLPFDGEVDLTPAAHALRALGVVVYLPVIQADHQLLFAVWQDETLFHTNRYGIIEPIVVEYKTIKQLDVVFLPLVGFDALGNRLGMGGGYYDRTLVQRRSDTVLIGVAHQCQYVDQFNVEPWDVPLDMVISEQQVMQWSRKEDVAI